jgi:hypothetical protein
LRGVSIDVFPKEDFLACFGRPDDEATTMNAYVFDLAAAASRGESSCCSV